MALGFGAKGEEDVIALISKKNYAKAIEVLKKGKADPRAKMQLADVLVLAGKGREAVAVLEAWLRRDLSPQSDDVFPSIRGGRLSRDAIEDLVARHARTANNSARH